jgi:hypothetical protein
MMLLLSHIMDVNLQSAVEYNGYKIIIESNPAKKSGIRTFEIFFVKLKKNK